MQDADLFMELAAIAGVFVGFGALIAVRSGGAFEPTTIIVCPADSSATIAASRGVRARVTRSRLGTCAAWSRWGCW